MARPSDYLELLDVKDTHSFEEVNGLMYRLGLTDGLPVVPPTEERVERMLGGRDPERVLAAIPPGLGQATLKKVAVCAVMAGCRPEYLPVLMAAVEAVARPEFNPLGVLTTTGNAWPMILVNGPIIQRCELNFGHNALGPGVRANATIGRAFTLILRNIAGAIPGKTDMATQGQPAKYGLCVPENEGANPWGPFHVSRGFRRDQSVVTVIAIAGTFEVVDGKSTTAAHLLTTFANSMTTAGSTGGNRCLGSGEPLLFLSPEIVRIVGREMSRADAQRFLFDHARLPLSRLSSEAAAHLTQIREAEGEAQGDLLIADKPESILLVVLGGVGIKSTYAPTWGGGTRSVSLPVEME
ncbi:MAG: hypothetical protein HY423_13790 [Candidatus Lambdaproteobacteria bacterium]|nr:hypothetical protein [Candidatus Lambdaproteobacteria bacterium]